MAGKSSSKGDPAVDKSLLPYSPLHEGRTEEGTQKEASEDSSWRLLWLFKSCQLSPVMHGSGGNNRFLSTPVSLGLSLHCPAQGPQEAPVELSGM